MAEHDGSYHRLFSDPRLVEDLLRHFVPAELTETLDFSAMERVNTKFHSEGLQRRDGDIIYRIPGHKQAGEIYLYLLLEFQSRPDHHMALRIMVYTGLLYQQLLAQGVKSLPPVLPLVLYNGDQRWRKPLDLSTLIALPDDSPLWPYQPQMRYYLIEQNQYPEGKGDSINGAIFRLENVNNGKDLLKGIDFLSQLVNDRTLRRILANWVFYVLAPYKGLELETAEIHGLTEVRTMLANSIKHWQEQVEKELAEKAMEKGRKEGIEKGRKEGIEKGMEEGLRNGQLSLLCSLLEKRFGPLPPWAVSQLEQADTQTLQRWALQFVDATDLEEVFA